MARLVITKEHRRQFQLASRNSHKCQYLLNMEYNMYMCCSKFCEPGQEFCEDHMKVTSETCLDFDIGGHRCLEQSIPGTRSCMAHQDNETRRKRLPQCQVILETGEQCYLYPRRDVKTICTYHSCINADSCPHFYSNGFQCLKKADECDLHR